MQRTRWDPERLSLEFSLSSSMKACLTVGRLVGVFVFFACQMAYAHFYTTLFSIAHYLTLKFFKQISKVFNYFIVYYETCFPNTGRILE